MTAHSAEPRGAPVPPEPPTDGECCGRGCEHCVWLYYHEARRKYEEAHAEWESTVGRG